MLYMYIVIIKKKKRESYPWDKEEELFGLL